MSRGLQIREIVGARVRGFLLQSGRGRPRWAALSGQVMI